MQSRYTYAKPTFQAEELRFYTPVSYTGIYKDGMVSVCHAVYSVISAC